MDEPSAARYWIVMAGRGWGKTRTGAEWLAHEARTHPNRDFGVVGRTIEQTREVCMEGESGLLRALGLSITSKAYNRTTQEIKLPNGATIYAYTAENPDSMRGPNLSGAWCDELASWHYEQAWTEGLIPATRIGEPLVVITTTPKRTKLLRDLISRDDSTVRITRGSIDDNAANLSEAALTEMHRRYDGTRIGRQELHGDFLEDVPGALWTSEMIERGRARLVD
jgi:phage terminase large subunit-like protein